MKCLKIDIESSKTNVVMHRDRFVLPEKIQQEQPIML